MAKLPDAQALGERPVPSPRGGIISGPSNAGLPEAVQARDATKGVVEFADQLAQASNRIMTREETVERARAYTGFESAAAEELRRLTTEGDFSKRETAARYGEFLSKKRDEFVNTHGGRPESQAMLAARLEQSRFKFADAAAAEGLKAEQKLVADTLGMRFNSLTDRAYRTDERLDSLWKEADDAAAEMAPALNFQDKLKFSKTAKEQVGIAKFNQLFDRGAWGEAEKLRDATPIFGEIFGAEAQKNINHRIMTMKQKEIEESTKGIREARQDIIKAQAIAQAAGGTPEDVQVNFLKKLGLGPEKLSEFEKLSNEVIAMERAGLRDTREYKDRSSRLAKLISSDKMTVEYDSKSGTFTLTQGSSPATLGETTKPGAGLGGGLTAPQALVQGERLDNLNDTIKSLDSTIEAIVQEPSRAGVFGSIRRGAQTIVGVGGDLAKIVSAASGVDLIKLGAASRQELITDKGIPKNIKETLLPYFDPKLTEMELFENTLAIQLAKLRILSGGSDIRAIESAFKIAQKDTKMTGLKSSQEVLTKLNAIRNEFITSRDRLGSRLGGGATAPTEDREEKLKRIFGGG